MQTLPSKGPSSVPLTNYVYRMSASSALRREEAQVRQTKCDPQTSNKKKGKKKDRNVGPVIKDHVTSQMDLLAELLHV